MNGLKQMFLTNVSHKCFSQTFLTNVSHKCFSQMFLFIQRSTLQQIMAKCEKLNPKLIETFLFDMSKHFHYMKVQHYNKYY
jgi:hypothetical protein